MHNLPIVAEKMLTTWVRSGMARSSSRPEDGTDEHPHLTQPSFIAVYRLVYRIQQHLHLVKPLPSWHSWMLSWTHSLTLYPRRVLM